LTKSQQFTILFSCIGRRVAVVHAFRDALRRLGLPGTIVGTDSSPLSAALQVCDRAILLPRNTDPGYIDRLVEVCLQEHVDLVLPLIDPELTVLAGQGEAFRAVGTTLCLSSREVISICRDKVRTCEVLSKAGIDTPRLMTYEEVRDQNFPVFMKPRGGSAAKGVHRITTRAELDFFHRESPSSMIQECIEGQEYTLDIFTDFTGRPLCVVPRIRLEVRSGEVSKSMILKDPELMAFGRRTIEALPGCMGPITLQCFRTKTGRVAIIEINPRLGGGVPLSIAAGADIPTWTILSALGRELHVDPLAFQDRLYMSRYDEAVFVAEGNLPR
jgi:carbamoyl-phosphate synthase large subunit